MKAPKAVVALTLTAVGAAALSTSALAWRGGDRGERMIERVAERLELDDNQRAALDTLAAQMRETRELVRGDHGSLRESAQALLGAPTLDQGAALALIEQRTAAVQSQAPELVAAAAVFLDGLTPGQKADIEQFLDRKGRAHRQD